MHDIYAILDGHIHLKKSPFLGSFESYLSFKDILFKKCLFRYNGTSIFGCPLVRCLVLEILTNFQPQLKIIGGRIKLKKLHFWALIRSVI